MQTLNNSELNTVVGGCCANQWTAPEERVITLPIQPGEVLYGTEPALPSAHAFAE